MVSRGRKLHFRFPDKKRIANTSTIGKYLVEVVGNREMKITELAKELKKRGCTFNSDAFSLVFTYRWENRYFKARKDKTNKYIRVI